MKFEWIEIKNKTVYLKIIKTVKVFTNENFNDYMFKY